MRPHLTFYFWTLGLAAALAYAGAQILPPSPVQQFIASLPVWMLSAAVLLFGLRLAPLPLLMAGRAVGQRLGRLRAVPEAAFLLVCFACFAALAGFLSGSLFHHVPHVNDSINQYIHAKFIASGHISIASHPLKEFFDSGWMVNDGSWYSPYSPAHILFLALGHVAGLPWLVNPILGALTVIAVYFLAKDLYSAATARLAALLTCLCPLVVFMSSEYMNHATALLFATLFLLFFMRMLRTHRSGDAALAAAAFGVVALTRPLTALGLAIPFAAVGIWRLAKQCRAHCRAHVKPFAVFLLMLFLFALFQGWWNLHTTGNMFEMAYHKLLGDEHLPGFGRTPWGKEHTLMNGVSLLLERITAMNEMLFEWPLPSLAFALMLFLSGMVTRSDWLLLAAAGGVLFVHLFFQGHSEAFGPRYIYETAAVWIALTAEAIVRWPAIMRQRFGWHVGARTVHGVGAVLLFALFALAPQTGLAYRLRIYSQHYWEGNYDYYASIAEAVRQPALVFIPADGGWPWPYLHVAFTLPPAEDAPVIFANGKGKDDAKLIAHYPCRFAYAVRDNTSLLLMHEPAPECGHAQ